MKPNDNQVDSVKGFISNSKILIMTVEEIHEAQRCPQEPPEDSSIDASQKKSSGFHERLLDLLNPDQRENGLRLWQQLKFFFMNPLDKYRTRQTIPFKIFVEALKVAFVTTQLILFARLRISHVDFLDETLTVMRHKFLKEWGDERDTHTYPPTSGRYSIYNGDQIIQHFAHIITTYYSIQEDSFTAYSYDLSVAHAHYNGSWNEELDKKHIKGKLHSLQQHIAFDSIPPLQICINRITDVKIVDQIYVFDNREKNECFLLNFTRKEVDDVVSRPHVLSALLVQRDIAFHADDSLIICKTTFNFNLRSIRFSTLQNGQKPECYLIKVTIGFDNSRHTGLVRVDLATSISFIDSCFGQILKVNSYGFDTVAVAVIDLIVMCMCLGSFFLSLRALIRGHLLKNATRSFFDHAFGIQLSVQDQWEFFSPWHAMIVVNDFLLIVGTVSKLFIQFRDFDSELLSFTGVLLGLGVLLVFFGLQRYFTFFSQYNIIILTLRKSLPSILRYLVCAVILYSGFLFAGWVIIGPYSLKFRTLAESSETLFSLLNGDDMFATFYTLSDDNIIVKVFGTVYIYLFISLFIYVVLSLFIAIILDAYEVVKNRLQKKTHLKNSALREFMGSSKMAELDSHELRVENQHFASC